MSNLQPGGGYQPRGGSAEPGQAPDVGSGISPPKKSFKARKEPEPATPLERQAAADAAAAIRTWLREPSKGGEPTTAHLLLTRPRRGAWFTTWPNLPGLTCLGGAYAHALLPGWEYTPAEMRTEMLDDLDVLAATGERPKQATRW